MIRTITVYRFCRNCFAAGLVCHCMGTDIKTPPAGTVGAVIQNFTTTATDDTGGVSRAEVVVNMINGKAADVSAPMRQVRRGQFGQPDPRRVVADVQPQLHEPRFVGARLYRDSDT